MKIISNEKQKDNFAKYLYDISKIIFAVAVVGPIVNPERTDKFTFIFGFTFTLILFILASIIDRKLFNLKQ